MGEMRENGVNGLVWIDFDQTKHNCYKSLTKHKTTVTETGKMRQI